MQQDCQTRSKEKKALRIFLVTDDTYWLTDGSGFVQGRSEGRSLSNHKCIYLLTRVQIKERKSLSLCCEVEVYSA